jgi:hypothetical protein
MTFEITTEQLHEMAICIVQCGLTEREAVKYVEEFAQEVQKINQREEYKDGK